MKFKQKVPLETGEKTGRLKVANGKMKMKVPAMHHCEGLSPDAGKAIRAGQKKQHLPQAA